jgi:hypothetical protein
VANSIRAEGYSTHSWNVALSAKAFSDCEARARIFGEHKSIQNLEFNDELLLQLSVNDGP